MIRRALAGLAAATMLALGSGAAASDTELDLWPAAARAQLDQAIAAAPPGAYATFDADNTLWRNDIEEALLPYLENKGVLSVATLDPSLRPIPLLPGESLYGYYQRLCAVGDNLCYPWIAQVFAGRSLATLKRAVDAMMAGGPIPVRYAEHGRTITGTVLPPAIFPAQRQLIAALQARGIRVYVVTASAEELVRMVVSDPKYRMGIAPADVIGVTMLLRDPVDGSVTTSRTEIAKGHYLDAQFPAATLARMTLTPTLWSPLTWHEGKVAAISAYIDPVRRPMLAAGDSRSDWPMLFHSQGVRIWVDRKGSATPALAARRAALGARETALGMTPALPADAGWLVVAQDALGK